MPALAPSCFLQFTGVIRPVSGNRFGLSSSYLPSVPPQLAPPRTCTSPVVVLAAEPALLTCPQAQCSLGCIIGGPLAPCNPALSTLPRPGPRPRAMWLRGLVWALIAGANVPEGAGDVRPRGEQPGVVLASVSARLVAGPTYVIRISTPNFADSRR